MPENWVGKTIKIVHTSEPDTAKILSNYKIGIYTIKSARDPRHPTKWVLIPKRGGRHERMPQCARPFCRWYLQATSKNTDLTPEVAKQHNVDANGTPGQGSSIAPAHSPPSGRLTAPLHGSSAPPQNVAAPGMSPLVQNGKPYLKTTISYDPHLGGHIGPNGERLGLPPHGPNGVNSPSWFENMRGRSEEGLHGHLPQVSIADAHERPLHGMEGQVASGETPRELADENGNINQDQLEQLDGRIDFLREVRRQIDTEALQLMARRNALYRQGRQGGNGEWRA